MRKRVIDERISSEVNKIGYQTRILMSALLMVHIFYKIFILQENVSNWIIEALIFIVAYSYFVGRCTLSGLIILPAKREEKQKMVRNIILVGIVWELLITLGYFVFFPSFNMASFDNLIILIVVMFLSFICYCGLIWILTMISSMIANKNAD